ncbi:hypothetical protein D9613_002919 [Agrocybe pediades]|uniref:Uncharacterized protein n=1 Tax=Agrocybe pediades TaxID=84607 RepID=A0A8H4VL84_9AGAR|nr:hypothetical protein D9613_002919 [Agrocybe pediades]KAF9567603.1 hypothetical protein CPC08DRAFT_680898 [Agrocybe pediades]
MSSLRLHRPSPIAAAVTASKRWTMSLGFWGASAGAAALLFLSVTPLVRREVLQKVPVLGSYYEDKTPASDKPF